MWRGDAEGSIIVLPQNFNYWLLLLKAVFPFANHHLYEKKGTASGAVDKDAYGSTIFYDALGLAFSISAQERAALRDQSAPTDPSSFVTKEESMIQMEKRAHRFEEIIKDAAHDANENGEAVQKETGRIAQTCARVMVFYRIPAVKFMIRALVNMFGLALYAKLVYDFTNPAELQQLMACTYSPPPAYREGS